MKKIKLTNKFHNTECEVRPDDKGRVSARAMKSAQKKLCGVAGCRCGEPRTERGIAFEWDYDGSAVFFEY